MKRGQGTRNENGEVNQAKPPNGAPDFQSHHVLGILALPYIFVVKRCIANTVVLAN